MTREEITEMINDRFSNTLSSVFVEQIFTELIRKFSEPIYTGLFWFSNRKYKFNFSLYPNGGGWCYLYNNKTGENILSWNNYENENDNCSSLEDFLEKLKALNFDDEKNILSDARQISIEPDPAKTGWCKG